MPGATQSSPRRGDRDLARERAMDNAYSENELLWALARKRVGREVDIDDEPRAYVTKAIEDRYDALREEFDYHPVLTREDWAYGVAQAEGDRAYESEVAG